MLVAQQIVAGVIVTQSRNTSARTRVSQVRRGRDGLRQTLASKGGLSGISGQVTIVVRNLDGTDNAYEEPWKLRLVSFDIEDENGDGVFEPGENMIVRRIRISNFDITQELEYSPQDAADLAYRWNAVTAPAYAAPHTAVRVFRSGRHSSAIHATFHRA